MSEDAELKLKIAQLSGRINRKEQEDTNTVGPASFVKPAPPHASSNGTSLINAAVYERQVMTRAKDMEETRKAKARSRDEREKRRLNRHLQRLYQQQASTDKSSNGKTGTSPVYEIMIQGIRFRVTNGGSRLLKIPDELHSTRPTPKRANVGGVTFVRSKTGNLYRSGIVKAKR
ncbi:MAG: hypothetical protein M1832_000609 [Thelocarpon impressellum]|nr:MAG: hypothetical protein M1832_000609 [Thelocarpon impressellum]